MGQLANRVREAIEAALTLNGERIKAAETEKRLKDERVDVTMPGKKPAMGHTHPLSIVLDEIKENRKTSLIQSWLIQNII